MVMRALVVAGVVAAVAGCKPDFGTPASLVTERRILAVRAEPPEVRPTESAVFTALVVSPDGTVASPAVDWSLCVTPKPLDENNIVSSACLTAAGVMPVAAATASTMATVPANACALFGPDPPPQMMGQPPLRLVDGADTGLALERVTCDLAQAGADLAVQYGMTYRANANPSLQPLTAMVGGAPIALTALPAAQAIDFSVGWPADAVESFQVFDVAAAALVPHRESMRVSWFASAGSFLHEVTGRDETDTATTTANSWTAPSTPGPVHLWIVLRDSRGGVDFASYELVVTP